MRRRRKRGEARTLNGISAELDAAVAMREARQRDLFRAIDRYKACCKRVRELTRELDRAEALAIEDAEARTEEGRVSAQQSD